MFKWDRVIVAILLVPTLLFVYAGESFFYIDLKALPILIFTNLVVGIGTYEFYSMIKQSGKQVYDKFGIFVALLIPNFVYLQEFIKYTESFPLLLRKILFNFDIFYILVLVTLLMLVYRIFKNQIEGTLEKISLTLLGIIYVSVFFSQILLIYAIDPIVVLMLQILVWVSDTMAGVTGMAIGRKFFKNGFTEISPKKSVEGALGSIIFTAIAFVGIVSYFEKIKDVSLEEGVVAFLIGAFISVVAQIGDLIESLFKRECGVKDSGTILMGHGGILDRFDSMILVLPFVTVVIYFFHLCISYKYGI